MVSWNNLLTDGVAFYGGERPSCFSDLPHVTSATRSRPIAKPKHGLVGGIPTPLKKI